MHSGGTSWLARRLFRNTPEHRFSGIVHEYLEGSTKVDVARQIAITNLPDKRGKESSTDRDIRLCTIGMQEYPTESRYALYYARALKRASRFPEALEAYQRALMFREELFQTTIHSLYQDLAICYLQVNRWGQAAEAAQNAIKHYAWIPQTFCILGDALLASGHPKSALTMYCKALGLPNPPPDYPLFVDESFYADYPQAQIRYIEARYGRE
jgi:tetratricopeptide (TPR) repeat protein